MPADLMVLMRHASIQTTLRYYVARNAEDLMDNLRERLEGSAETAKGASLGASSSKSSGRGRI